MIIKSREADKLNIDLVKAHLFVNHNKDDLLIQSYMDTSLRAVENFIHKPALVETHETYGNEVIDGHKLNTIEVQCQKKPSAVFMVFSGNRIPFQNWSWSKGTLIIKGVPENTHNLPDTIEAEIGMYATDAVIIDQARLLLVGTWYTMRADNMDIRISELPNGINNLLLNISGGSI